MRIGFRFTRFAKSSKSFFVRASTAAQATARIIFASSAVMTPLPNTVKATPHTSVAENAGNSATEPKSLTPMKTRTELLAQIECYLGNGGLFNPEMMGHDKVRDLLVGCRDFLSQLDTEITIRSCPGCGAFPRVHEHRGGYNTGGFGPSYQVQCHCGWSGPLLDRLHRAIDHWNRRTPQTPTNLK